MKAYSRRQIAEYLLISRGRGPDGRLLKLSRRGAGYVAGIDYLFLMPLLFLGLEYGFIPTLLLWLVVRAVTRAVALSMGAVVLSGRAGT